VTIESRNRALLFGAIRHRETRRGPACPPKNPLSTAACLRAMGVGVEPDRGGPKRARWRVVWPRWACRSRSLVARIA